mmetsp:Transcript_15334/g.33832  ORF Transcript_15334/g.33832 Transcript_15334/m.33832 type:complete len:254 (-) Transcript_15334:475-1236(-)
MSTAMHQRTSMCYCCQSQITAMRNPCHAANPGTCLRMLHAASSGQEDRLVRRGWQDVNHSQSPSEGNWKFFTASCRNNEDYLAGYQRRLECPKKLSNNLLLHYPPCSQPTVSIVNNNHRRGSSCGGVKTLTHGSCGITNVAVNAVVYVQADACEPFRSGNRGQAARLATSAGTTHTEPTRCCVRDNLPCNLLPSWRHTHHLIKLLRDLTPPLSKELVNPLAIQNRLFHSSKRCRCRCCRKLTANIERTLETTP